MCNLPEVTFIFYSNNKRIYTTMNYILNEFMNLSHFGYKLIFYLLHFYLLLIEF